MRGLLIVNRHATSMTATVTDLAVRALAGQVELRVERTRYRGHARELAETAAVDLIIVHGGDGSINEVVNGVMGRGADLAAGGGGPLIAVIPGGGANVLARALGVPLDAAAAIRAGSGGHRGGQAPHNRARPGRGPVLHLQRGPGLGRRGGAGG